ncbi:MULTISPECIES: hypothetical protein [unclassified Spiroplasma]|uniref:hypothetical protein n=1 Tax=unclassified Spiroplasma TaxID=2637901 RepID=UPI00313C4FFA
MIIKSIKPITEQQIDIINKEVASIRSINNQETYTEELINLNSECLMCFYMLNKLARNCVQATRYLDSWSFSHSNNKKSVIYQRDKVFKNKNASYRRKILIGLIITIKWLFFLSITPIFLLLWTYYDPYQNSFCRQHFGFRPIKKEQKRRKTIYFIFSSIWLLIVTILCLHFMKVWIFK